ncbi:Protein of unknown function (DUF3077) [Azomonas agilis]|uniref:Uncharacterized protein n=1 Tax=Azomonas agilis TaxID=116849 RepID=A0A562J2G0_9GAMM|nr:DUF3077 domain-containing protein [Azomonas agilis]TWH77292.1 Protein of unknown function (DUF3077) [Azomonas agilis]
MVRDPRLFTTGTTSFPALTDHDPLLQIKAGVPLDEALNQAGILMNMAGALAHVIAAGHNGNDTITSDLAQIAHLLNDIAFNIMSDVERPVSQLCKGQGGQP